MPTKISHFRLAEENKAYIKNIRDDHKLPTDIDEICLALKIYSGAVDKARVKSRNSYKGYKRL